MNVGKKETHYTGCLFLSNFYFLVGISTLETFSGCQYGYFNLFQRSFLTGWHVELNIVVDHLKETAYIWKVQTCIRAPLWCEPPPPPQGSEDLRDQQESQDIPEHDQDDKYKDKMATS